MDETDAAIAEMLSLIHILLGAELRLTPAPEDYLCYGLTEELLPEVMAFLDTHPSLSALHEYLNARDMLLVQAHPFLSLIHI